MPSIRADISYGSRKSMDPRETFLIAMELGGKPGSQVIAPSTSRSEITRIRLPIEL